MAQVKQQFYNGKEWIEVTSEIQTDENGIATGHFIELNREYINKFGIFDNEDILKSFMQEIDELQENLKDNYYICHSPKNEYYKIFSTYSLNPTFPSLSYAMLSFLQSTFLLPQSYEIIYPDNSLLPYAIIEVKNRESEKTIILTLSSGSEYVDTIGG